MFQVLQGCRPRLLKVLHGSCTIVDTLEQILATGHHQCGMRSSTACGMSKRSKGRLAAKGYSREGRNLPGVFIVPLSPSFCMAHPCYDTTVMLSSGLRILRLPAGSFGEILRVGFGIPSLSSTSQALSSRREEVQDGTL